MRTTRTRVASTKLDRQRGSALLLTVIVGVGLIALTALSMQLSRDQNITLRSHRERFRVKEIAESAIAQAVVRIKEGGQIAPVSGNTLTAEWIPFGGGDWYYDTTYDSLNEVTKIRAWGRLPIDGNGSGSTVPPDDSDWDGDGYTIAGLELVMLGSRYVPDAPVYFGNGGIERPMGGFEWGSSIDPTDPASWIPITSGPSSYQDSSVPLEINALDHPMNHLLTGDPPTPFAGYPHPHNVWVSQNSVGQFNIDAFLNNGAGAGDGLSGITPAPDGTYYDTTDSFSENHPYAVLPGIPDVQSFSWQLWTQNQANPDAFRLSSGSHSGTYGTAADPRITFVTGNLNVKSGDTFEGTGVLVIRDDYDPNVDLNNRPGARASAQISGTFEWTGLVVIAGWAPEWRVRSGGDATILGAFFGEDSVQSGGEISLDSATIIMRVEDDFRILYSSEIFRPGGLIHDLMPALIRTVVGVREL